jgi:hypothetical protein
LINRERQRRIKTLRPIKPEEKISEKNPPNIANHSEDSILSKDLEYFLLSKILNNITRKIIKKGIENREKQINVF